ncbi:MAG: hypothetical protein JW793_14395 [Acidobacteria bacterium]|nr:hypothetical protein [Acidobacteriota bacterium]
MRFLKDVLYTDSFLIKGHVRTGEERLSGYLNNARRRFIELEEAVLLRHGGKERIPASRMQVHIRDILFAHESEETGDAVLRNLAKQERDEVRMTAYFSSAAPLQISGKIHRRALDANARPGRDFIVVVEPAFQGLPDAAAPEYGLFRNLRYVIVNRDRIAFLFQ